jgi:hypothetical protein
MSWPNPCALPLSYRTIICPLASLPAVLHSGLGRLRVPVKSDHLALTGHTTPSWNMRQRHNLLKSLRLESFDFNLDVALTLWNFFPPVNSLEIGALVIDYKSESNESIPHRLKAVRQTVIIRLH